MGDIMIQCSSLGCGADTADIYSGKPIKGVHHKTKRECFFRTFNSGHFSFHNEADNFFKIGDHLTVTRRVLGLFKSAGEQNKNPIHTGIQSMLRHLNITAADDKEHFFLNEPLEKGSIELGAVRVPKIDESLKKEDIRMNNVGYIPPSKRRFMSKRMAKTFESGTEHNTTMFEKKGSTNPEDAANRKWYNKCRIAKAVACPQGTKEEKKAASAMNRLIYERLAGYAAVNRALREQSKSFN
jgi:hypothetical protein